MKFSLCKYIEGVKGCGWQIRIQLLLSVIFRREEKHVGALNIGSVEGMLHCTMVSCEVIVLYDVVFGY